MIRLLDIFFSLLGILALSLLLILLWIFGLFENGSPIFKQIRVGRHQKPFILFKFRTMPISAKLQLI
jgi:O-antigen biosynthesis protein WbqP